MGVLGTALHRPSPFTLDALLRSCPVTLGDSQHQAALDAARDARAEAADLRTELSTARDHLANASRRIQKLERDNESLRRIESNVSGYYRSVISSDGRPPLPPAPGTAAGFVPATPLFNGSTPLTAGYGGRGGLAGAYTGSGSGTSPTGDDVPGYSGGVGGSSAAQPSVGFPPIVTPTSSGGGGGGGFSATGAFGSTSGSGSGSGSGGGGGGGASSGSGGVNPRDIIARTARFLQRREDGGMGVPATTSSGMAPSRSMPTMPLPPTAEDMVEDPFHVPATHLQMQYRQFADSNRAHAMRALEAADGVISSPSTASQPSFAQQQHHHQQQQQQQPHLQFQVPSHSQPVRGGVQPGGMGMGMGGALATYGGGDEDSSSNRRRRDKEGGSSDKERRRAHRREGREDRHRSEGASRRHDDRRPDSSSERRHRDDDPLSDLEEFAARGGMDSRSGRRVVSAGTAELSRPTTSGSAGGSPSVPKRAAKGAHSDGQRRSKGER